MFFAMVLSNFGFAPGRPSATVSVTGHWSLAPAANIAINAANRRSIFFFISVELKNLFHGLLITANVSKNIYIFEDSFKKH